MKALSKTVLFSRVVIDKRTVIHPVGVFANDKNARSYFTALSLAHKTGDAVRAKELDPAVKMDDAGKLLPNVKFSITEVTYEPDLPVTSAEDLESVSSHTL